MTGDVVAFSFWVVFSLLITCLSIWMFVQPYEFIRVLFSLVPLSLQALLPFPRLASVAEYVRLNPKEGGKEPVSGAQEWRKLRRYIRRLAAIQAIGGTGMLAFALVIVVALIVESFRG